MIEDVPLYNVETVKIGNRVLDAYRSSYFKRYKTEPILSQNGTDQTILKDMARSLGEQRTIDLLEHYLKMDNDWFVKKGHNLETFKREMNVVNSDMGLRASKSGNRSGNIKVFFSCDGCMVHSYIEVPFKYDWDQRTLCSNCRGN